MTAGQQFVKMLRPVGCVLCLIVLAAFLLIAFRSGSGKALDIGDYAVPESLDVSDAEALGAELARAVLPQLPGESEWYTRGGRLHLTFESAYFADCRQTVLQYYPDCGIQFHRAAD